MENPKHKVCFCDDFLELLQVRLISAWQGAWNARRQFEVHIKVHERDRAPSNDGTESNNVQQHLPILSK